MSSTVQICNMALSHIGAGPLISAINPPDGSTEAGYCAAFYDQARIELLEGSNWDFALKRADLASITNVSTTWAYAYALPSDCLSAKRVLSVGAGVTVFNQDQISRALMTDRRSAAFDIEGATLFTNEPDATLVYVTDVIDTGRFTPAFSAALSYLLAAYLAGPIVRGAEGARLSNAMRSSAMSIADLAATAAANASSAESSLSPSILAVRA